MKPLVDADVLLYEVGYISQEVVDGEVVPKSWDYCQEFFDGRIKLICEEVGATEDPLLFLTSTPYINGLINKRRKREDLPPQEYKEVFRHVLSTTREYKGGRLSTKPFHFKNLINYILSSYPCKISENGLEADDEMCIYQILAPESIICSRDKDVRQVKGWHYSWECGKQPSVGPFLSDAFGGLVNKNEGLVDSLGLPRPLKVFGWGNKFFYYQMITGDSTDNIVGLMGRGPVFAYNLLKDSKTEREAYELTAELYVKTFGDEWEEKWNEMASLLWMVRELDSEGKYVPWQKPSVLETIS
jgi:5'-3' exonuclease